MRRPILARWRKISGQAFALIAILAVLLTISPRSPVRELVTEVAGILLVMACVVGRIWCALYIAGRKNAELCQDGPYSLCRNPLYWFSFLGVVGLLLAARLSSAAVIFAPVFWGYHHFVIRAEEQVLLTLFGTRYERYRGKVPRYWPQFFGYWSRPALIVDPRLIVRALSEVAWFLLALACIEVVEHFRGASLGSASLPVIFTWPF